MSKLLFCLQVSPIDADAAIDLAELIKEIDSAHPNTCRADWLISYMSDTPRNRVSAIERSLCNRFENVWLACARHHARGWPGGPNALWRSTMEDVAELAQSGKIESVGILTFEADCVPMRSDWIDELEKAYAKRKAPIVGNLVDNHFNGNCMFPTLLAVDWPELLISPREAAWDYFHRQFIVDHGADTNLITQYYRRKAFTGAEWQRLVKNGVRPALLHGIKDNSARKLCRSYLLPANRTARSVARPVRQSSESLLKSTLQPPV